MLLGLVDQLYSLLLLDIRLNLRPQSNTDLQAIQYIHTLQGFFDDTEAATWAFLQYCMGRPITTNWRKYQEYMDSVLYGGFFDFDVFMEHSGRCGVLYCPAEIRHTRVAYRCLDILTGTNAGYIL